MKTIGTLATIAMLLGGLLSPAAAVTFTMLPIEVGDDAPGLPGLTIAGADWFRLNNSGELYFQATVAGTGVTTSNDFVAYVGPISSPTLVWREGDQAATFPVSVTYKDPTYTSMRTWLADDGRLVFAEALVGTPGGAADDTATWLYSGGSLTTLFHEGDQAPGLPTGVNMANINVGQNCLFPTSTGKLVQKITVAGTGVTTANDIVVYRGTDATNLTPIIREGDAAPDGPSGAIVDSANSELLVRADNTLVAGKLLAGSGGVTTSNDSTAWITDGSGDLQIALREGDAIAGTGVPDATLKTFSGWAFVADGHAMNYGATLQGTGISSANDRAVLVGSLAEEFRAIAREGNPAPDLTGVNFGNSFGEARFGNDGTILLQNALSGVGVDGTNDYALFRGEEEDLHLLVREGQQAPGFDPGVLIQQWSSSSFTINDTGGFVMLAPVGDGLGFTSEGLFTVDAAGNLELLLKRGDMLETSPGTFKVVSDLGGSFSHTQETFNDLGQAIIGVSFTDATGGTFLVDVTAVPEPSTLTLLAVGFVGVLGYAWRKQR